MRKLNKNNGITLIALVISIIVMLILVAVSISMAVNGGLFNYAGKATVDTQNAIDKEKELAEGRIKVGNTWYDSLQDVADGKPSANQGDGAGTTPENPGEGGGAPTDGETISKEEPYIGYYVDVDEDGTVDGVIYADLVKANSGIWNPSGSTFTTGGAWSYSAKSNLKEYVVSKDSYEGVFGTKPIIKVKASSIEGTDRFYVMSLSDINSGTMYCWYAAAYDTKISDYTNYSYEFGKGKTNTHNMITAWNSTKYGAKDDNSTYKDVWGEIQKTVYGKNYTKDSKTEEDVIWFLQSANEWAAFGSAFGITTGNYSSTYKLNSWYWSSSLIHTDGAYYAYFYGCFMSSVNVGDLNSVRLSATF